MFFIRRLVELAIASLIFVAFIVLLFGLADVRAASWSHAVENLTLLIVVTFAFGLVINICTYVPLSAAGHWVFRDLAARWQWRAAIGIVTALTAWTIVGIVIAPTVKSLPDVILTVLSPLVGGIPAIGLAEFIFRKRQWF